MFHVKNIIFLDLFELKNVECLTKCSAKQYFCTAVLGWCQPCLMCETAFLGIFVGFLLFYFYIRSIYCDEYKFLHFFYVK
jgi:hypothetical protein